jgi:hypothetical protein
VAPSRTRANEGCHTIDKRAMEGGAAA